jgi:hypothetical protein
MPNLYQEKEFDAMSGVYMPRVTAFGTCVKKMNVPPGNAEPQLGTLLHIQPDLHPKTHRLPTDFRDNTSLIGESTA